MTIRTVTYGLVAAGVMALVIAAKAQERTVTVHIYIQNSDGSITRGGSRDTTDDRYNGSDWALVCTGDYCAVYGERWCEGCHGGPVDRTKFEKHVTTYFPRSEFPVAEGQRLKIGKAEVTRLNGVLVLQDERGRRFQLPPGAIVVKARDGRPQYVGYPGATAPVFR